MPSLRGQLRYFGMWAGWIKYPRLVDFEDHNLTLVIPQPEWGMHYRDIQAKLINAGLKIGNTQFSEVRFYTTTLIPKRLANFICAPEDRMGESERIWGFAVLKDKAIVLCLDALAKLSDAGDTILLRHEMTHIIRGGGGHEKEYFNPSFNNVWHGNIFENVTPTQP